METNTKTENNTVSELRSLLYVIVLALIIRTFIIELFFVPTGSMKATILEGDYIFSTKYSYGYSKYSIPFSPSIFKDRIFATMPKRGDIVIFRPPMKMDIRYIKRLIGLPGDKVQLISDLIYINDIPVVREEIGELVDEKGIKYQKFKEILPDGISYTAYKFKANSSTTEPFYVPQGHFFFLGDNRDDSNDSRADLGFVPFENFIAKGQFILFSTEKFLWLEKGNLIDNIMQVWSRILPWLSSIRCDRLLKNVYSL